MSTGPHDAAGAVLTSYGKEIAVVLPMKFTKVAFALVHLAENARVNAAMDEADADSSQIYVPLEKLIAADDEPGGSAERT